MEPSIVLKSTLAEYLAGYPEATLVKWLQTAERAMLRRKAALGKPNEKATLKKALKAIAGDPKLMERLKVQVLKRA